MKASSLLAVDRGAPERVAADGNPMNLFWFFLKLGSRAIFYSYSNKSNMKTKKVETYVFSESLFVEVGLALDFAGVV